MRVLFYGGCHASALHKIFAAHASASHVFETLINFQLIRSQTPFPYDYARTFDAIVFSPIANRGDWNTSHLIEFCAANNIPAISYPWLQWNAYHPGSAKGPFVLKDTWFYPALMEEALRHSDFESFYEAASGSSFEADKIPFIFEQTTNHMKTGEITHQVSIPVSDFIIANYRQRRLFLTPDHPSRHLYKYVAGQIAERLGIALDRSFFLSAEEPQEGLKLPIYPSLAERLGLDFIDCDYQDKENFPGQVFSWRNYLRLYHTRPLTVMRSIHDTFIKAQPRHSTELEKNDKVLVKAGAMLIAQPHGKIGGNNCPTEIFHTSTPPLPAFAKTPGPAYFYPPHWKILRTVE